MRRARWKRKNVRDELTGKAVNSPKTGAGRHELPTELETPLPAALYLNLKSVRRRICGHGAQRGANRTPSASLSAAAPAHLQSRVVRCEAEHMGVEIRRFSFAPRCATGFLVRGCSSGWSRYSAAGRRLPDLVGSAWRPAPVLGDLTRRCQIIPDIFSFPPCTAHFLFDVSKRKWGVHSPRQSRASCPGSRDRPLRHYGAVKTTFL